MGVHSHELLEEARIRDAFPKYNALRISTAHFNYRLDIDHLMNALSNLSKG